MSGRLVILPHKSWNVWNQDNREKVARDERLHREAEEAKAEKAKLLLQEQNLEQLQAYQQTTNHSSSGDARSRSTSDTIAPFRLFEDLERANGNKIGNEEYLKEKALKEQIQKRKDGIADWALGEGSYENSKTKPWYAVLQPEAGSSSATIIKQEPGTASASKKEVREITRKEHADPMSSILHLIRADYKPKHKNNLDVEVSLDRIESKEPDPPSDIESDSKKRSKKDKKRHREKEKEHKPDHKRSKHSKDDPAPEQQRHNVQPVVVNDALAALRQKRLEREAVERKRAAMLLASVDIYGPGQAGGPGSGYGNGGNREYSQQYNPHLARAYKR